MEGDYARLVAALALMSASRPAAEDAAQEALVRAWERVDQGQRFESMTAWITAVATNLIRSGIRRRLAERRALARVSRPGSRAAGQAALPDEAVDVARAIAALPRRQREALVLHYWLEFTVAEIAEVLGVSQGTVKSALHRGRRRLAQTLTAQEVVA